MIYKIPVIGFIYALVQIEQAQNTYFKCHAAGGACWKEYDASWLPFDQFNESVLWTAGFFAAMILLIRIWVILQRKEAGRRVA